MEFKAEAVQIFTNTSGMEIMLHPDGETILARFVEGQETSEVFESALQHTDGDEYNSYPHSYFVLTYENGETAYFDLEDFIRINYPVSDHTGRIVPPPSRRQGRR